ncbi:MAG: sodium/solute symporter [Bacteroidetes bacterium]|jgi:solute:Na+ symporter, SSS family|nr:sodium/solute symporter [Bacteroidota bacterium]MBT3750548.1 sodium/solute symporter [Bacteroidota bacterium]MBT4402045.1 sodium/solute symporter [Bacteroidota bacterium]MBT4408916.1 sodium/solute symporter [Bacteroidota bacterium]MBT5424976.1 sodium/solute symporter [Bacteroidota bacterium]
MNGGISIPLLDLAIIIVYLLGILTVGIWVVRKQKMTSNSYFLAGRSLNWAFVGAALFASNISTIHLVGLAAAGYRDGMVQGNFEWMAAFLLIVLGLVFAPFYFKNKISTLPEFLERRYSGASRTFLAFLAIIGALFMHIGISLYAGAVVFETFFGIDKWVSIIIISVITSIYTVMGGLKAVVITETIQTVILILGAGIMAVIAVLALPDKGINSYAELKEVLRPDQMVLLRSAESNPSLPWYSIILGYPVIGLWYWCADQTIVQRVLGARSLRDAQIGPIFAGFIKILPVFIMVVPGILAYALFSDIIGDNANEALPVLITQLLPTGLKGLLSAALMAALMSTIAAALNSSATLVSVDIVKRIRPKTTDRQQVNIGRWTAVAVMLLAIAWSPMIERFRSIFDAINTILSVLAPPIAVVFIWGVFWKRGTKQASLITIITGFIVGALVFMIDFPAFEGIFGEGVKPITDNLGIPYMMQGWWLFVFLSCVYVLVSFLTPRPDPEKIKGLVFDKPLHFLTKGKITGWTDPRVLSGILVVVMIILYSLFS